MRPDPATSHELVREFIRPAVRAVPSSLARRLGSCRITLGAEPGGASSRWTLTSAGLQVSVATAGIDAHDAVMELLQCLGQALWERLSNTELHAYWTLLRHEISTGIEGEIDEQSLQEKRGLLKSRARAGSSERLTFYALASFAGTLAEYIHSLWHDVTIRTGPDYLPAAPLRRRLELIARWFPPDRGYRLFPAPQTKGSSQ